jgi:hypothetical protein
VLPNYFPLGKAIPGRKRPMYVATSRRHRSAIGSPKLARVHTMENTEFQDFISYLRYRLAFNAILSEGVKPRFLGTHTRVASKRFAVRIDIDNVCSPICETRHEESLRRPVAFDRARQT